MIKVKKENQLKKKSLKSQQISFIQLAWNNQLQKKDWILMMVLWIQNGFLCIILMMFNKKLFLLMTLLILRKCFQMKVENQLNQQLEYFANLKKMTHMDSMQLFVLEYDKESEQFVVQFQNGEIKYVYRIFICFDIEDPKLYIKRLANAFQRRLYADSLIRQKYYIQAMPIEHLASISSKSRDKIELLAKQKFLGQVDLTVLMMEIDSEFQYSMNGIIFDKYLQEAPSELIPHSLALPRKPPKLEQSYYGRLELAAKKGAKEVLVITPQEVLKFEPKDYIETFKMFCLQSCIVQKEAIVILQEVRRQCNSIQNMLFFNLEIPPSHPYKIEEFKQEQYLTIQDSIKKLKEEWVPHIESTIATQFDKLGASSPFDIKEKNIQVYEQGKLHKFMVLVGQIMNDSILFLSQKTFKNFYDYFNYFIPENVEMKATNNIKIQFKNGYCYESQEQNSLYKHNQVKPLFTLELLKNSENQTFYYSNEPKEIQAAIESIFDKLLDDLNRIPCVEKQLLHDLFRKAGQLTGVYIKAPQRKRNVENDQFEDVKSQVEWDENKWITDIFERLSSEVNQSLKPLNEYLKFFDQYKSCLLYTSDAADDMQCVDLGGRRIIKKKKKKEQKKPRKHTK
eukprot:TRINITY_DN2313_c0_g1_i1.p1 TRINITY_DN2313_c0_g1~~TRINITY_DN2313_c0_g1_i1.p1  ORF type:complete len:622 (+),score=110.07 TRINITY_DN2313_c0_g1_i1:285-2150(+)